jgi:hypothetical protein
MGVNMPVIESVYDVDERVFTVSYSGDPDQLNVGIVGCTGTGPGDRHLQENIAGLKYHNPDFVILNGDLGYGGWDDGIKTERQLRDQLVDLMDGYDGAVYMGWGNHEYRMHGARFAKLKDLEKAFIGTTRFSDGAYKASIGKGVSDVEKLQAFVDNQRNGEHYAHAPANPTVRVGEYHPEESKFRSKKDGYYSISCKATDADDRITREYIVINTNTLSYDEAQKAWLRKRIATSTAEELIIVGHHPMVMKTVGKRRESQIDGQMYADANAKMAFDAVNTLDYVGRPGDERQARQAAYDRVQDQYRQMKAKSAPGHGDILHHIWEQEILGQLKQEPVVQPEAGLDELVMDAAPPEPKLGVEGLRPQLLKMTYVCAHDHYTSVGVGDHGIPCGTYGGGGSDKEGKPKYDRMDDRNLYGEGGHGYTLHTHTAEGASVMNTHYGVRGEPSVINQPPVRVTMATHLQQIEEDEAAESDSEGEAADYVRITTVEYTSRERQTNGYVMTNSCHTELDEDLVGANLISREQQLLREEPRYRQPTVGVSDALHCSVVGSQAINEFERELDLLAENLPGLNSTPEEFATQCREDPEFKRLVDMINDCRHFICRLREQLFDAGVKTAKVEHIANTLRGVIKAIREAPDHVLTAAVVHEHRRGLSKLASKYESTKDTKADIIYAIMALIAVALIFRLVFMTGGITEFNLRDDITLNEALETGLPTVAGQWLALGAYRWKGRPPLKSDFFVQLGKFVDRMKSAVRQCEELPAAQVHGRESPDPLV